MIHDVVVAVDFYVDDVVVVVAGCRGCSFSTLNPLEMVKEPSPLATLGQFKMCLALRPATKT